jgi:hypothetical protein
VRAEEVELVERSLLDGVPASWGSSEAGDQEISLARPRLGRVPGHVLHNHPVPLETSPT